MKCNHQFVKVSEKTRLVEDSENKIDTKITGVKVVCALCAEKRGIFIDGTIHIYKNKGNIEVVELPTEYLKRVLKKNLQKTS